VIRHQYQTYRPQRGTIALWIFVIILAWMYVRSLSRAVAYNVELQAYDESLAMVTIDEPPFLKPEPAYQAVVFLSRYIGLDDLAAYNEAIGFVTTLRAMLAEEGVGLVLGLTDLAACRMPTAQGCLRTFSRAMDAGKDEVRSACLMCALWLLACVVALWSRGISLCANHSPVMILFAVVLAMNTCAAGLLLV